MFKRKKKQEPVRNPSLMEGQNDYAFRRSRTLTGTASSEVSAAAEGRSSHLKSPRMRLHQLRRHRQGLFAGILVTLACILGLGWLISQYVRDPASNIRYAQPVITEATDTQTYARAIEGYFAKRPVDRFAFRLDHARLMAFMQSEHPEIKNIEITADPDGNQDVAITFREPILSWNTGDSLLFIDQDGVAFGKNYFDNPAVSVEDKTGVEFTESEVVVSDRFMTFLGRMVGYINQGKVGKVSKVIIPADTLRQIDVQLKGKRYPIKTHIDRDPYTQAQDVINTVRYLDKEGKNPRYVDVRVEGRAYYR
jgi:hypothetical protein